VDVDQSRSGYVTDTAYESRVFRELSPAWLNYVTLLNGFTAPDISSGVFSYLELGCGFGLSTAVNAATYQGASFHACDINSRHIASARSHAERLGVANIAFHHCSFEDLLLRDLPAFDFIVLHGVYSWVDRQARAAIDEIIRNRLSPGGVVYISYNCFPGWAVELPLQRLLLETVGVETGSMTERTEKALRRLERLREGGVRYFTVNGAAKASLASWLKQSTNYIVHEYLAGAWKTFYSIDVASAMATIGCRFAGSATLADNHPELLVGRRTLDVLMMFDLSQRPLLMDFATNRRFRRDVFVRADALSAGPDDLYSVLLGKCGRGDIPRTMQIPRGSLSFHDHFIQRLRQAMQNGPQQFGELIGLLNDEARTPEVRRNILYLIAGGVLCPVASLPRTWTED